MAAAARQQLVQQGSSSQHHLCCPRDCCHSGPHLGRLHLWMFYSAQRVSKSRVQGRGCLAASCLSAAGQRPGKPLPTSPALFGPDCWRRGSASG